MQLKRCYTHYNEIDPFCVEWLRELMKSGLITEGEIDERSIEDVRPIDLRGFRRCHFFAGIGVWDYAIRNAGWPEDVEVWTGSCPCQPFSAAGKRDGFDDERHLWPAFFWLIQNCHPRTIFGEQVAGRTGYAWLDIVSTDLGNEGYSCRAVDIPAAGCGAPHVRQRLYWCANANGSGWTGRSFGNELAESIEQSEAASGYRVPFVLKECALLFSLVPMDLQMDSGGTQNGSSAQMSGIGQLNPCYARWLMGLPIEWDYAAFRAAENLKAQKSTSRSSKKAKREHQGSEDTETPLLLHSPRRS